MNKLLANRILRRDLDAEVDAIYPKAMPVILMAPEECRVWMTAPWEQVRCSDHCRTVRSISRRAV